MSEAHAALDFARAERSHARMGSLETFRARLQELGIDAQTPLDSGVGPLEEHAASVGQPVDAWLTPLLSLIEALHAKGVPLWSPLRFSVAYVAKVAGADAERFSALLGDVGALLLELHGRELDTPSEVEGG